MFKFIAILFLFSFNLSVKAKNMENIPGKNITITQLDEMFSNISEQGQWDTSKELLWGYFFTDSNPEKLEKVIPKLQEMGYKIVDIFQADKDDPKDPDLYYLHIEKIEIHNSKSLDLRNNEFYLFAHKNNLDTYDGMDVGPVDK